MGSAGVFLVSLEDGSAARLTIQGRAPDASPVLFAAWAPSHDDHRPTYLGLASADRLEVCLVDFFTGTARVSVVQAAPLKRYVCTRMGL